MSEFTLTCRRCRNVGLPSALQNLPFVFLCGHADQETQATAGHGHRVRLFDQTWLLLRHELRKQWRESRLRKRPSRVDETSHAHSWNRRQPTGTILGRIAKQLKERVHRRRYFGIRVPQMEEEQPAYSIIADKRFFEQKFEAMVK